jgi:hypothetical protein
MADGFGRERMNALGVDVVNSMDRHTLGLADPTQTVGAGDVALSIGIDWICEACKRSKFTGEQTSQYIQKLVGNAVVLSLAEPGDLIDRMRRRARGQ